MGLAVVVGTYAGEKLEATSPYLGNDLHAKPIMILDFALDKRVSKNFDVFYTATNLLNSAYQMYIKKPVFQQTNEYPYQSDSCQQDPGAQRPVLSNVPRGSALRLNKN